MQPQRLDKLLAGQGMLSRKEVKDLIRNGSVRVDGAVIKAADFKVSEGMALTVMGKPLTLSSNVYLMLHKPKGVVSASKDPNQKTVVDLVPPELARKGLFPAGRLDKDTTGFVLLTDDGELAHRILSPKNHIPKKYLVTIDCSPNKQMEEFFSSGALLASGEKCLPAQLKILGENTAEVTLCEGMYHQIKRMFAACGAGVVDLHRFQLGGLLLDPELPPGGCRMLSSEELKKLEFLTV